MKKQLLSTLVFIFSGYFAFSQVQIDRPIDLNSTTPGNARIMGIKEVSDAKDAVSAEVLQKGGLIYKESAGGPNAYTLAISPAVTPVEGTVFHFKANIGNAAGGVTLNGIPVKKDVGTDLAAGDIQTGQLVTVAHDGTRFQLISRTTDANSGGTVTDVTGTAPIVSSGGNTPAISITAATTSAAGSMSAADKTKLNNATNLNTANTLVLRDASGNFSAGTISAALNGNATTATSIAGGTAGKIPYQSGIGTTVFTATAPGTTAGMYMRSTGVSNTWNASAIQASDIPDGYVDLVNDQSVGGNKTWTGQIISTRANNAANGAGQIYLGGANGNRIDYIAAGVAPPAFTTRSAGTKIVLYPGISASLTDYALGIDGSTLWYSVPGTTTGYSHKFYGGTTELMRIRGDGNVGIGITAPLEKLHVNGNNYNEGFVVGQGLINQGIEVQRNTSHNGPDDAFHTVVCSNGTVVTRLSIYATSRLDGGEQINCLDVNDLVTNTHQWRGLAGAAATPASTTTTTNTVAISTAANNNCTTGVTKPTSADDQFHSASCLAGEVMTGFEARSTGSYLDGCLKIRCTALKTGYVLTNSGVSNPTILGKAVGNNVMGVLSSYTGTGDDQLHVADCPAGTFPTAVAIYACDCSSDDTFDGRLTFFCSGIKKQ